MHATRDVWRCGLRGYAGPNDRRPVINLADRRSRCSGGDRRTSSDSLPSALTDGAAADGKWDVSVRRDSYPVDEHAEVLEVIRTVDPAGETEDIVIYLTDLPRRLGTTPVIADISVHDRFGLISIPGVGGLFIDRRVRNLAQTVVAEVTCQSDKQHRSVKRLTRTQEDDVVRYVAPTALSRLQLLMGMVYANRPWRLAAGLSKVLMAAFAAGAVSLAYPTIWQLSDTMGPWRLSAATILASAAMIAWLILDHELWERPHSADERERAVLYNAATVVTLTIGVVILHIGLFILLLVTAWWTLPPQMVARQHRPSRRPLNPVDDGLAGGGGRNIGRCPGIGDGG